MIERMASHDSLANLMKLQLKSHMLSRRLNKIQQLNLQFRRKWSRVAEPVREHQVNLLIANSKTGKYPTKQTRPQNAQQQRCPHYLASVRREQTLERIKWLNDNSVKNYETKKLDLQTQNPSWRMGHRLRSISSQLKQSLSTSIDIQRESIMNRRRVKTVHDETCLSKTPEHIKF